MKQQVRARSTQYKLPILTQEPDKLPPEKQRELVQALAELLLEAASETVPPAIGGGNESEAHD